MVKPFFLFLNHPFAGLTEEHEEGQKIIPAGGPKHAFWDESNVRCRDAGRGTTHRAPVSGELSHALKKQKSKVEQVVILFNRFSYLFTGTIVYVKAQEWQGLTLSYVIPGGTSSVSDV